MREIKIKFRALSLDNELIYFDLYNVGSYYPDDDIFYVNEIPCRIGTEQQYTGLKDRNGEEIYEDSFLKTNDKIFLVIYICENAKYILEEIHGELGNKVFDFDDINLEQTEVIGNKWKNPELLEEKKG